MDGRMKNGLLDPLARRWRAIPAGFGLSIGVLLWFVPYRSVEWRACPVSGSSLETTRWFGVPWKKRQTTTHLETWLRAHELGFEPRLGFVAERSEFAYGRLDHACGNAPAVFSLARFVDAIVDENDDTKISSLVTVIRHGTEQEQERQIFDLGESTAR